MTNECISMCCFPLRLLVLFIMIMLSIHAAAQQKPEVSITGRVSDAETSYPLENVIVFLANTPFGTSTIIDGEFTLTNVPPGDYEMVISCIGYERQMISLQIREVDSLYYDIKLRPQPVRTEGVEVLGERPDAMKPKLNLFFPEAGNDAYCVYGTGNSLPIGILFSDSALYMYSLDTATINNVKYIRLWLLYENLSEKPYDLNPMVCLRLHVQGKDRLYKDIQPEPPTEMTNVVTNEKAVRVISERIEKTISILLLWQKQIRPGYIRTRIMSRPIDAKQGTDADKSGRMRTHWNFEKDPTLRSTSSEYLSTTYQRSVHAGILQRYTVYPNNSVNGFVFFPFPGLNWKAAESWFTKAAKYKYEVEIITQNGSKMITFAPH